MDSEHKSVRRILAGKSTTEQAETRLLEDAAEVDGLLARVAESGDLVLRGAQITQALFDHILRTRAGAAEGAGTVGFRHLDVTGSCFPDGLTLGRDFRRVIFAGKASFRGASFQGDVVLVRAVFRKAVSFDGAHFGRQASFSDLVHGAEFEGRADFRGCAFDGDARFHRCSFRTDADFTESRFGGRLLFGMDDRTGASRIRPRLEELVLPVSESSGWDLSSWKEGPCEAEFVGPLSFAGARFEAQAVFAGARIASTVSFKDAAFLGRAEFRQVRFDSNTTFDGAVFSGHADFKGAHFGRDGPAEGLVRLGFQGVTFEQGLSSGPFSVVGSLDWREVKLNGPLELDLDVIGGDVQLAGLSASQRCLIRLGCGRELSARRAVFADGLSLTIHGAPTVDLRGAGFLSSSWIGSAGAAGGNEPSPRLEDLRHARVAGLTVSDLDLGQCRFAHALGLQSMRIQGATGFGRWSLAPVSAGRQVIREERDWRQTCGLEGGLGRGCAIGLLARLRSWWRIQSGHRRSALRVSETYRALRNSREAARDWNGADDFYYGEMEMRRVGAPGRLERFALGVYWFTSGYGLRAGRAFTSLLALALLAAAIFHSRGVRPPEGGSFVDSLRAGVETVLRPLRPPPVELEGGGSWFILLIQIVAPILLALGLYSLRRWIRR